MPKIEKRDALQAHPEFLNEKIDDHDKAIYAKGWNDCNKEYYNAITELPVASMASCTDLSTRLRRAFEANELVNQRILLDAADAIEDSGDRTQFETGAVRDMHEGKGRFDLLPWAAIWEVAKHCENGATKYGERNCEKGIPIHSLIDSAFRHLCRYMEGETDEPHLVACAWNVLFAIWMELRHPEMQDIPSRKVDKP